MPDLLADLRADPDLIPLVVEEVIRWSSPAMHVLRVATSDVTIAGRQIPAGDAVAAWLPSANRDERAFPEPDRFLPRRSPNRHLGFGFGSHHFLGAALARIEIAGLLRALAATARAVTLTSEPEWMRALQVQGYRSLLVDVEPLR